MREILRNCGGKNLQDFRGQNKNDDNSKLLESQYSGVK